MPKPYLVGWYCAFEHLWKLRNFKRKWYMWKQLIEKKYYWLTTEERVEANKKCFDELRKINIEPDLAEDLFNYNDEENEIQFKNGSKIVCLKNKNKTRGNRRNFIYPCDEGEEQ